MNFVRTRNMFEGWNDKYCKLRASNCSDPYPDYALCFASKISNASYTVSEIDGEMY